MNYNGFGSTYNASLTNSSSGPLGDSNNSGHFASSLAPPHVNSPASYTSSPISPIPPTLPPIPRVASVRSIIDRNDRRSEEPDSSHMRNASTESWLRPLIPNNSDQTRNDALFGEIKHARGRSAGDVETNFRKDSQDSWVNPNFGNEGFLGRESVMSDSRPTSSKQVPRSMENSSSPAISRPQTAGSSMRSHYQSSNSTMSRGAAPDPNTMKGPPIVFMGPALKEPITSPSKFPSESHRPPPRPPPPQVHSFTTVPKLGPAPKPSKNKLNLLNPMSLLKRRSGPGVENLRDESLVSFRTPGTFSSLPADFDPSIRGKVVHDFSAPREKRTPSRGTIRLDTDLRRRQGYSPPRIVGREEPGVGYSTEYRQEKEHTPVFKELFEDGIIDRNRESAIRAEQLANQDFISRNSGPPPPVMAPPPPPSFAPPPPPVLDQNDAKSQYEQAPLVLTELEIQPSTPPMGAISLSPVVEDDPHFPEVTMKRQSAINRRTTASTNRKRNRRSSAASRTSQSSIGSDISASGLPTHMSSRASRFSFQLAGKDSAAQERMLEERHKQREAARKLAEKSKQAEDDISEEDDYDFDGMDDFEEDVPMVGDEWNYGDDEMGDMGDMSSQMSNISAPSLAMMALRGNPVDYSNMTMPAHPIHGLGIIPVTSDENLQLNSGMNDGISRMVQPQQPVQPLTHDELFINDFDDDADDLYFDDGVIDEADFDDTQKFDESVLDDPNHPLYERKPVVPVASEPLETIPEDTEQQKVGSLAPKSSVHESSSKDLNFTSYPNPNSSPEQVASYHDILAAATVKAAQLGRFERKGSIEAINSDENSPQLENGLRLSLSQPSLIPDESRTSKATTISPILGTSQESPIMSTDATSKDGQRPAVFTLPNDYNDGYNSDYDNFLALNCDFSDYESTYEEDPFIAAANADALANDFDGEYGSEFGFYARPDPDSENEDTVFANGGYFGPKEWGEIKRQRSTREPNLTPITERSEYSTRNSFVSLHAAASQQDIRATQSPGLAQLARMSPAWDTDMNIDALMKLRRGAFGGSQTSLRSLNSNRDAPNSPLASSPIVAKIAEPRFVPTPLFNINQASDVQVSVSEVAGNDGEWEDASSEEEDSDYTDTEDIDEEGFMDYDTSVIGTQPQQFFMDGQQHQLMETRARSFSRPFANSDPYQLMVPASSFGTDTPEIELQPPTQDSTSSTVTMLNTSSRGSTDTIEPAPSESSASTSTLTSTVARHRPTPLQTLRPLSRINLLSPLDQKAAGGTFYSPASSVASPTKSTHLPSPTTKGHSRTGSDSVAYVRESIIEGDSLENDGDEEFGSGAGYRWVLERRRTGEDGVEEVLGREVVTGGAI
jgi:hypothetical protein